MTADLSVLQVAGPPDLQLSNPTKERVKGPSGRRLPSKKAAASQDKTEIPAALRDFRSAARIVRDAEESDQAVTCGPEQGGSEACRQGVLDVADFDRAWFFRVPSLACQAGRRRKTSGVVVVGLRCENNNMQGSSVEEELPVEGSKEEEKKDSVEEGGSAAEETKKRRFWRNREFNCNIL